MNRLLTAAALLLLAACVDPRDIAPPGEEVASTRERITQAAPEADVASAVQANTALGLELLAKHDGNFVLSSYSITSAASMVSAGAQGDTLRQIEHALQQTLPAAQHHRAMNTLEAALESRGATAKGKDGKPFRLVVTNQLFGQKGQHFEAGYLDTLAQEYGSGLRLMDFSSDAARKAINDWVGQRTEGKITDLFAPSSLLDARLAIVNTLYFNAAWEEAFPKSKTLSDSFTLSDGSTLNVPMMHNDELDGARAALVDGVQVLELPYDGGEVSLVVLAPPAGKLADFEQGLDAAKVTQLVGALQGMGLDVRLPKFTVRSSLDLTPDLRALGMTDAFEAGTADFSAMTGDTSIFIGVAVHQAVIILDENGTEAAAATGISGFATSVPPEREKVTIDRPFLFFVRDVQTGAVLFSGRVVDPR